MTYPDIINVIRTKEELNAFVEHIDVVLEKLYSAQNTAASQYISTHIPYKITQVLGKIMEEKKLSWEQKEQVKSFLLALKEELQKSPVVHLKIAFWETEATLNKISTWVRSNMDKNTVIDIMHDFSLIGAAVVVSEGRYHDYSLKKALDEEFKTNYKQIVSIVNFK